MVKNIWIIGLMAILCPTPALAQIPDSGIYKGHYHITMRAAPLGNVLGFGVNEPSWTWNFDNDTATVTGTTLSVGFNYALHDINNVDPNRDELSFTRNNDGTLTLHYALQIYHPGLGNPMSNTSTRFAVLKDGAQLKISAVDWEVDGSDGIAGTKIYNVFPLTIEPDYIGSAVQEGVDSNLDGIDDVTSSSLGLNPNLLDSDGDGISDWIEIGGNVSAPLDSDSDSIIDALESGDTAHSSFKAYGLSTLNGQRLNIDTSSELSIKYASIGSMQQKVTSPDTSDDFATLDSTLGQPGLDYPWGNLSLAFGKPDYSIDTQEITLTFSDKLPDKLLVYAFNPQAANNYQLVPQSLIQKVSDYAFTIKMATTDPWISENSSNDRYQLTIAISENKLGNKSVDEQSVSAGGHSVISLLVLIGFLFRRQIRRS